MIGININCKETDFISLILSGQKTIETRNKNTLKSLVGCRVGLIQTGKGKATLKGYATITKCDIITDVNEFRQLEKMHCVLPGSKYDFKKVKYCYYLTDITRINEPIQINSFGISYRKI